MGSLAPMNPVSLGMGLTRGLQDATGTMGTPGLAHDQAAAGVGGNSTGSALNGILNQISNGSGGQASSLFPTQAPSTTPQGGTGQPLQISGSSSVQYPWSMWG